MLTTAGVLSYKAVIYFGQTGKNDSAVAYQDQTTTDTSTKINTDGIYKNLIYCYDDKTKDIDSMVLEMLDTKNGKLSYFTIPMKTQVNMSASLYKKLVLDFPEIPQILRLSAISDCFDSNKVFAKGMLIVEDLLKTDINYYTAIPKSTFDTMFTQISVKQTDGYDAVPEEVFTSEYKYKLQTLNTEDKFTSYIKEVYPDLKSSLDLNDKLKYANSYVKALSGKISFDLIEGSSQNSAYIIDTAKAAEQMVGIQ